MFLSPYLNSREEAEKLLAQMEEILNTYEVISVKDMRDLLKAPAQQKEDEIGWTNLFEAQIKKSSFKDGKWFIKLPTPIILDASAIKKNWTPPCKRYPKCQGCTEINLDCFVKDEKTNEYVVGDIKTTQLLYDKLQKDAFQWHYGVNMPKIKDVIFNGPATIVFWEDGVKTVVKCQDGDNFDPEKGLAMAISKRVLGNKRDYYYTFRHFNKKWAKQDKAKADQLKMDFKQAMENKLEDFKRRTGKE